MIHPAEFICPLCGKVLDSWTAFRAHVARNHEPKKEKEYEQ